MAPMQAMAGSTAEVLKPLTGLRVVALEQAVAAPLCSRHLADLGADVIKIERPPAGDLARSYDSVVDGLSAYFVWANRGKRSISLDLSLQDDRGVFHRLLANADVFVHNLGHGAVERLGFGPDVVARVNPSLINCAISGYGATGPYRDRKAFDLLIQGEAGLLSITGEGDSPAKVGISIADMCAAVYALSSILAALHQRADTDRGSYIDIALLDCLAEWMTAPAYHHIFGHTQLPREAARHNMIVPYGVYPVDGGGHVNFAVHTMAQWESFCEIVMDIPHLATDQRFLSNELRVRNRVDLEHLICDRFTQLSAKEVTVLLEKAGVPFGEVRDLQSFAAHPQLAARHRWMEVTIPSGHAPALRAPFNIVGQASGQGSLGPAAASARVRVPALGEDTDDIRNSLAAGDSGWPSPSQPQP